jgi:C-terminal processing protease CtpA/Prc
VSRAYVSDGDEAGSAAFARRFDHVDRLVRTRYYARDFNGVAWDDTTAHYRPRAVHAASDAAWYQTVNEMLRELRDAHTRVCGPEPRGQRLERAEGRESSANSGQVTRVLPDGTVYLRFGRFDAATVKWLQGEVAAHQDAPAMVVDLRHNPGGLVASAQRAVGLFFSQRVSMGWVVQRNGRRTIERSRPTTSSRYLGPLAVLVGPDSRSSAEVFAYVMQYQRRAVVVGEPTAGQVLGARPFRLPDGGQLYISVSGFHRFDGEPIEGRGVKPDVRVRATNLIAAECAADVSDDPAVATALTALQRTRTDIARAN